MLSCCFLDFSVDVGAFVIGLSEISSFFSNLLKAIVVFDAIYVASYMFV